MMSPTSSRVLKVDEEVFDWLYAVAMKSVGFSANRDVPIFRK